MGCCSSARPQIGAEAPSTLTPLGTSGLGTECVGQEQGLPTHTEGGRPKEGPGLGAEPTNDLSSLPDSAMHVNGSGGTEGADPGFLLGKPHELSSVLHTDDVKDSENPELSIKGGHDTVQSQGAPSISNPASSEVHTNTNGSVVITNIRAADVVLGLGRLPAGFYTVIHHSGLKWRTENKRASVDGDVVEWTESIPLPSNLSAVIRFEVYASYEFQPMLGSGEQLEGFTTTTEEVLNQSEKGAPLKLRSKDRDSAYPCSSISVIIEWQKCGNDDSLAPRDLVPCCSAAESLSELENVTNQGHNALSCYRKLGKKHDLERSIDLFDRALSICPPEHPCRAAAQSNLATARFTHCQVEDMDNSFGVSLSLYLDALTARPIGHLDRPSTLIQLGAVHFARFKKQKDDAERAQAETLLHEALGLGPTDGHEIQAATFMLQSHVGHTAGSVHTNVRSSGEQDSASLVTFKDLRIFSTRMLHRFQRSGSLVDLQLALAALRKLVSSTPLWEGTYREELANFGVALSYRFSRLGEINDLEDAILTHRKVVELTPQDHPEKPIYLNNLGNAFDARFEHLGEPADLEYAISTLARAVSLTPSGHPIKPTRLSNLGNSLLVRFQRFGDLGDLEHALLKFEEAVDLTPCGQSHSPALLNNLGNCFFLRFGRLADPNDLDIAISWHKDAVDITPHGHSEEPRRLNNLGNDFRARFRQLGEPSDLEHAISTLNNAVILTPDGHPHKPSRLNNLGNCFSMRFSRFGELSDLDTATSRHQDALGLTPRGHPERPDHLHNLGNDFQLRFKRLGELRDLENAISIFKDAVELTPRDHPHQHAILNSLGTSFFLRFECLGELRDLNDAISRYRDATDLAPCGHPHDPICLLNLGNALNARFQRTGESTDIEEAVSTLREVASITHGNPDKPSCLNSLGSALIARFERLGDLSNIDSAILTLSDAVELTPRGHPHLASCLENLGNSFTVRFEQLGERRDLDNAILTLTDAVNLTPHNHPDKPNRFNSLGRSFRARFMRFGRLSDLEDAISTFRDAADLTPDGHPKKPRCLHNLGNSLITRFNRLGEPSDLDDTVVALGKAAELTPDDHPNKPTILNSLGSAFITHFEHILELSILEDAISTLGNAVNLTPRGHPHKAGILYNLGNSLLSRFEHLGELSDLEDAVSRFKDAVDLTPHGHPRKPAFLDRFGKSLASRFKHLGEMDDLEDAISKHRDAVELTPHDHPDQPSLLNSLGSCFVTHFECVAELGDLEQAISLFSRAASTRIGPVTDRFQAAQNWISCTQRVRHHSLLHAYSIAVLLLPELAWIGLSFSHRYREIKQGADVVREAAAAALDSGLVQTAIEWLEQGRSIIWGELFQLRSSYEGLSSAHPDHARRLRELSSALEDAGVTREKSLSAYFEQTQNVAHLTTESLQQEADRHRRLAIERDEILQEIRGLPGFERFLRHKEFSHLRTSTRFGPVVILNAAESHCDALILLANVDHVIHVPLPNLTIKWAADRLKMLKSFVRHSREGQSVPCEGITWEIFLAPLWKCVVKPVLDAMAFSIIPGHLPRIFWCPTGPFAFLPIHAAGFYDDEYLSPGHKIYDFVVSSYTPTLDILTQLPNPSVASNSDLHLLAVRQPRSDGLPRLPGVAIELEYIKDVIKSSRSAQIILQEPSVGTVEEVLSLMKDADWAHFACHGIQDATLPTGSGLCLADGRRLKLRDIIGLSRPHGGLAFLSACQTAKGDVHLSDEAIHIAAGMLFAGYGGVVGTMWSISDKLAPAVARNVYRYLFRNGTRPDYQEAAWALHEAMASLRDSGASFDEWIPFIHVGL